VNIPAVGARVRLRRREGVVSRASLGTVKRLGDEFVSSGAWIEVMLTDGKGYIDLLKLHESAWDDSSCSTPERRVVALFGRVLARQSGRLWDHGADRRRDVYRVKVLGELVPQVGVDLRGAQLAAGAGQAPGAVVGVARGFGELHLM
jgi:hypothetical protein